MAYKPELKPVFKTDLIKQIQQLQSALGMGVDYTGTLSRIPKPRLQSFLNSLQIKLRGSEVPKPPQEPVKVISLRYGENPPEPIGIVFSQKNQEVQFRLLERSDWVLLRIPKKQLPDLIHMLSALDTKEQTQ